MAKDVVGKPFETANATAFAKGVSGNPGGKASIVKDLERAGALKPELAGLTPVEARAKWWSVLLPVAFAGPTKPNDTNWRYAHEQVGLRLLGKPKETVVIERGANEADTPIDWQRVPLEERERLLDALKALDAITAAADSDEAVEH